MADQRSGRRWAAFCAKFWKQFGPYSPPCALCGHTVNISIRGRGPWSRTVDHIIPVESGGAVFDIRNVQPAHRVCNTTRQSRPMTEFDAPEKRESFRKVVEALVAAQDAKKRHSLVLDKKPDPPAVFAPWGWNPNEGIRRNKEFFWKCCGEKPTKTTINTTHNCRNMP